MRGGDRVEDEVEPACLTGQLVRVGGNAHLVRAESQSVGYLGWRGGEQHDMGTHRVGQLDAHVTEAAKTDDADLLARPGVPVTQR